MATGTSSSQRATLESYSALTSGYRVKITPLYLVQGRMEPDSDSQLGSLFVARVALERAEPIRRGRILKCMRVRTTFTSVPGVEGEGIKNPEIVCSAPEQNIRYTMKEYNTIVFVLDRLGILETLNWRKLRRAYLWNNRSYRNHLSEGHALDWGVNLAGNELLASPVAMDLGVILRYPSKSAWKVTIEVQPVFNDYAKLVSFHIAILICAPFSANFLREIWVAGETWRHDFGLVLVYVAILTYVVLLSFGGIYAACFELSTERVVKSFTYDADLLVQSADVQSTISAVDPDNLGDLPLEDYMLELWLLREKSQAAAEFDKKEWDRSTDLEHWMLSRVDDGAAIARRRLYSDGSMPETFRVRLEITWELQKCILSDIGRIDSLLDVVTLSGSPDHSVATKCVDYVQATWGSRGTRLFSLLHSQILSGFRETRDIYLSHATKVTFVSFTTNGQISVDLHGYLDDIETAYQVLTWIVATFRLPKAGKLCSSRVGMRSDFPGQIRIKPYELQEFSVGKPGTCWQPLFPSSVIATDFPTLHDASFVGLCIPLSIMLHLSGTLHHVDLGALDTGQTGVYFKGVHSLLFPVRMQNNGIQWHMVWDENKTLPPGLIFDYENEWDTSLKLETLTSESVSHYLGYCDSAGVTLGTRNRLALYRYMATSRADRDRPSPEVSVNSTPIGLSHIVTGQISPNYKYRNGLAVARGAERQYSEVIRSAAIQRVILFETMESQERAWLVPQLCAILDLINWWCCNHSRVPDKGFARKVPDGGQAAIDVLDNMPYANTVLEAATLDDEKDITVGSKVKDIYAEMSKRAEAEAMSKRSARFTKELSTERLRGWDFLELLNAGMISYQRQVSLHRSDENPDLRYSPTWLPLAREVPVYFGRDLGELIVPMPHTRVCKSWSPLPGGFKFNYLAATLHCLKNLAESHGREDCCLVLDDLVWDYKSMDVFEDCGDECMHSSHLCMKRPQILCKRRQIRSNGRNKGGEEFFPDIPIEGAVVFSNAKSRLNDFMKAFWKCTDWIP